MKALRMSLLVLMVFSLMSGICYGQTAENYYDKGVDYANKGMYDEAIAAYKKAIEINPRFTKAYNNLGVVYDDKKMYDEAIAEYKKAIEINPRFAIAYNNLGLAYDDKGMFNEAIAAYKRAIEIDPEYAKAHNNLAVAYHEKGEYSLAIKHCDRAIELGYRVPPGFLKALKPYRREEVAEFAKLLKEAENYFLDEDYDRVKEALEKAEKILDQQIKLSQEIRPFFDLSTPENVVKSFIESAYLNDEETTRKCWSKRIPDYLVSMIVSEIQKYVQEKPELRDPKMVKLAVGMFRYERRWTGVNSYYVWAIAPGEERSEDMQFKVVRENRNWKVLAYKVWEEEDFFKALIGKK